MADLKFRVHVNILQHGITRTLCTAAVHGVCSHVRWLRYYYIYSFSLLILISLIGTPCCSISAHFFHYNQARTHCHCSLLGLVAINSFLHCLYLAPQGRVALSSLATPLLRGIKSGIDPPSVHVSFPSIQILPANLIDVT